MDTNEKYNLIAKIAVSFSPSAPIDQKALFAGRGSQIGEAINAFHQRGQHAVIFGERGVGKTSLANVLLEILGPQVKTPACGPINCDQTTTFDSLWRQIFQEMPLSSERPSNRFSSESQSEKGSLADLLPPDPTPDAIRAILQRLDKSIIVIDEVDRISDRDTTTLLADTIKNLSDHSVDTTIVLSGVADSVDALISEHESVQRALVQIRMPRMSETELFEILDKGLRACGMTIDEDARRRIEHLSQGLPHYAHLLALHSAQAAVSEGRLNIQTGDTQKAIEKALQQAQESVARDYQRATASPRENMYKQVLLACALADTDSLGFFSAADIRVPMSTIMGRPFEVLAFAQHLYSFCERGRGPVLQRMGAAGSYRFRFRNPLMLPYVILNGLKSNLITEAQLNTLTTPPAA
ncbi:MAG TPA: AAA family ATPase [Burkholderiales bacterium]|nr:AAA family ATPase [Burkholderiales bacterium]